MKYLLLLILYLLNFTSNSIAASWQRKCSVLENVFATVDFGSKTDPKKAISDYRVYYKTGPFVNSEYYPGWINRWEMPYEHVDSKVFCDNLDIMLAMNASINIYPVNGGTLFGFMAGGTHANGNDFWPVVTSYEFDGPLTEAGDPTEKYFAIRNVIKKYVTLPDIPIPTVSPKMALPSISMKPIASLFDESILSNPMYSEYPLRFEELKLRNGFILYSTNVSINELKTNNTQHFDLHVEQLADRAQVFVDKKFVGTLSRTHEKYNLTLNVTKNFRLDILVENQGRFAFLDIHELKGILKNVTLDDNVLKKWNHYLLFKNWQKSIHELENKTLNTKIQAEKRIPTIFTAKFQLPNDTSLPLDSFLKLEGWGKGLAFLNGFNLGRYWPLAGPQHTLYSPSNLFKPFPEENKLTVFELEKNPCDNESQCLLQFVKEHVLNGTVNQDI